MEPGRFYLGEWGLGALLRREWLEIQGRCVRESGALESGTSDNEGWEPSLKEWGRRALAVRVEADRVKRKVEVARRRNQSESARCCR